MEKVTVNNSERESKSNVNNPFTCKRELAACVIMPARSHNKHLILLRQHQLC